MTSRDQIASLLSKPTTPYLDHQMISIGQGNIRGVKSFEYLPRTITLCSIHVTISKLCYERTTSYDTRKDKLQ